MDDNYLEEIMKKLAEAEKEAYLNGIEANTIILNENHAYVKEFYVRAATYTNYPESVTMKSYPPMIMGKQLILSPLPDDYDFALTRAPIPEEDIEVIKKYVKIIGHGDNEQLVFKGISSKRNKEDFARIKRILGL